MSIVNQIRQSYPLPIAKQYEAMYLETEPRQRISRLIELFEGITHYLVLAGLANYIYYQLEDPKVSDARSELERPSLGSWINLLTLLDQTLRANDKCPLLANPRQRHRNNAIFEAVQAICPIIGTPMPKRVKIGYYLQTMVQFRNKKIGHGKLYTREAKELIGPLEAAINQWLAETVFLQQQQLIYVERIEWAGKHFVYYGTSLNHGTSLFPHSQERMDQATPDQVYLKPSDGDTMVPLYPFFLFDNDTCLLYLYNKLSEKRTLILECPYDAPLVEATWDLNYDESIVTGVEQEPEQEDQNGKENGKEGPTVSAIEKTQMNIRGNLSEEWLTDSQVEVWTHLNKLMEPPYYVINIYGVTGAGKTFLGWLLEKQGMAIYADAQSQDWPAWKGQKLVVLDGFDPSRRQVRSLRTTLQLMRVDQAIILTRQKAQDDIPCLHLAVTDRDIQIAKANLYRHLDIRVPDENLRNLWDCSKHLKEQT